MRWVRRSVGVAAILFSGLVALAPAAIAQDGSGKDEQIVLTGRLHVPEGETIRNAVIFDGDALIEGTITDRLVVFNGRTEITGTVGQDVIVFNGDVVVRSGARVGGDIVSLQDPQIEDGATVEGSVDDLQTRWDVYDVGFAGRYAWWLAYTVSTLVLGLVLLALAPGLAAASVRALRERIGATIGFGLLWFILLPVVAVLLMVTIVGIPLGLFLGLALALVYTVAYVVGAIGLGRLFVKEPTSRYLAFLAGWGALRVLALVPFVGGILWFVATLLGLGTLWVAARSSRGEVVPVAAAPLPPPPVTS